MNRRMERIQLLEELLLSVMEANGMAPVSISGVELVNDTERSSIVDVLLMELSRSGLDMEDEPNERGLMIEELIDFIQSKNNEQNGKNRGRGPD